MNSSALAAGCAFASRVINSAEGMCCGCANEGVEEKSSSATVQRFVLMVDEVRMFIPVFFLFFFCDD